MITEVCGLKSNMISKLVNHKKNREPYQSPRKLTSFPYRLVNKCLKLLITGMLNNVIFLGHTAPIKKGLKKKYMAIKKIRNLKQLDDNFLVEH